MERDSRSMERDSRSMERDSRSMKGQNLNHRENGGKTPWDGGPFFYQPHIHLKNRGYLDVSIG